MVGHAHAPEGQPLASVRCRVAVGELDKVVQIAIGRPIGLGPIAPTAPARAARLHRHAAAWDPLRWSERPLPDDFDFAYFNAAPADQILEVLTGEERIVLEHLHPRFPRLATQLCLIAPRATTFSGGQAIPLRCDTLVLDADRGVARLTWRGTIPIQDPRRSDVILVQQDPDRRPATPPPATPPAGEAAPASAQGTRPAPANETLLAAGPVSAPVLPFKDAADAGSPPGEQRRPDATQVLPAGFALPAIDAPSQSGKGLPPEPEPLPVEAYPIDRCARIAARIDLAPADIKDVLEAEQLDRTLWRELHGYWLAAIAAEADRGKTALRSACDAAYVAALEDARGDPRGGAGIAHLAQSERFYREEGGTGRRE